MSAIETYNTKIMPILGTVAGVGFLIWSFADDDMQKARPVAVVLGVLTLISAAYFIHFHHRRRQGRDPWTIVPRGRAGATASTTIVVGLLLALAALALFASDDALADGVAGLPRGAMLALIALVGIALVLLGIKRRTDDRPNKRSEL